MERYRRFELVTDDNISVTGHLSDDPDETTITINIGEGEGEYGESVVFGLDDFREFISECEAILDFLRGKAGKDG